MRARHGAAIAPLDMPPLAPLHLVLALAALVLSLLLLSADFCVALQWPLRASGVVLRAGLGHACHQRPERSLHLAGEPLGSCARCTGLHASGLLGGVTVIALRRRTLRRPDAALLAAVGASILLLDVGLGMLLPGWDHPWLRLGTGLLAGFAVLLGLLEAGIDRSLEATEAAAT